MGLPLYGVELPKRTKDLRDHVLAAQVRNEHSNKLVTLKVGRMSRKLHLGCPNTGIACREEGRREIRRPDEDECLDLDFCRECYKLLECILADLNHRPAGTTFEVHGQDKKNSRGNRALLVKFTEPSSRKPRKKTKSRPSSRRSR